MKTTALLLSHTAFAIFASAAPCAASTQLNTDVASIRLIDAAGSQSIGDEFGRSLSGSGNELAISTRSNGHAVIEILEGTAGNWTSKQRIDVVNVMGTLEGVPRTFDNLVTAGSLSASLDLEGNILAVGAHLATPVPSNGTEGRGIVLVYERGNANAPFGTSPTVIFPPLSLGSQNQRMFQFGSSVDVQAERIAVGAPGVGQEPEGAAVFGRSSGQWTTVAEFAPGASSVFPEFGQDVALHGSFLLVGAPNERSPGTTVQVGAVFSFDLTALVPVTTALRNFSPNQVPGGSFGAALASDGSTLLVGEPRGTTGTIPTGRAFEYTVSGAGIALSAELDPSGGTSTLPVAGAEFGTSLAIEGPVRVVGAKGPASQAQFAYEFHVTPNGTRPIRLTRTPLVVGNSDFLGDAVAIADNAVFVGARGSSIAAAGPGSQGVVFQFNRQCGIEIVPCSQPLNSAARTTRLEVAGVPSVSTDGIRFSLRDAPPQSYSALLSGAAAQTPMASMFGNGFECLGASSRSFASLVVETDAAGNAEFSFRSSTGGAMAGSTMYFQAIHRDRTAAGAATVNYSGVVGVQFCF